MPEMKSFPKGGITMDVREKLVDLIVDAKRTDPKTGSFTEYLAEYLIANGVTVQEWVSVEDRLPEDDSDVLAYLRIGEESRIFPANYAKGMWFDCVFNTPATERITHWMPMPQPPKGE